MVLSVITYEGVMILDENINGRENDLMPKALNRTLLSIEDDDAIRFSITEYFEDKGFDVFEAEDGKKGLEIFRERKPEVVLCDLRMPGVDGLQVLASLKNESPETPIIVVSGVGAIEDAIDAVRNGAWDYVIKPIDDMEVLEEAVLRVLERAALIRENQKYQDHLEEMVETRTRELRDAFDGIVQAMGAVLEIKDPYTSGHQRRVAVLARQIALEMNSDYDVVQGIYISGVIHDIGKIAIPAEILAKPTMLSEMEFEMLKSHSQMGYDILKNIQFPWPIAQIVYQHHERFNGSGYPQGLSGDDILLEARILAVADVVEAMASHRPYREALGIELALDEIKRNRGKLYELEASDVCIFLFEKSGFSFSERS